MKSIPYFWILTLSIGLSTSVFGQSTALSLDDCYTLAEKNYPQIKQFDLINQSASLSLENISKLYLPQLAINGQATYQSDVTQLPISLPGINIQPPANDQYKIYGEINQPLTDLFTIKQQKAFSEASNEIEKEKLNVELYALKDRVNQLYFGILLIDAQLEKTAVLKKELHASSDRLASAIENGVSLKSNASLLQIEQIKLDQRVIELSSSKRSLLQMLGLFLHQDLDENTVLLRPVNEELSFSLNRPELKLFTAQKNLFTIQNELITAKNLPHLGFFFQGGFGRPALNFLSNEFKGYYITGLRLNWNITGFYTMKREKNILSINQQLIDVRQETFEFNTKMLLQQQSGEIDKIAQLIETDDQIIELQQSVIESANVQLENGSITTNEYLSTLNALDQARLNKVLHEVQLLMERSKQHITTGN